MDDIQNVTILPTPEDRYYQPEWLEQAREELNATLAAMSPEERIAYINEQGGQLRPIQWTPAGSGGYSGWQGREGSRQRHGSSYRDDYDIEGYVPAPRREQDEGSRVGE